MPGGNHLNALRSTATTLASIATGIAATRSLPVIVTLFAMLLVVLAATSCFLCWFTRISPRQAKRVLNLVRALRGH